MGAQGGGRASVEGRRPGERIGLVAGRCREVGWGGEGSDGR
jgi:hypothetical protein